jgi:PQQ-like domain
MIRFRVGQSWKREPGSKSEARDAFAFEIDGVNLVPGAQDEPLVRVVASLLEAVSDLAQGGERSGQLSLDDVALEVCFWRRPGLEVEVTVVSLGQPPRRAQPPVVVELPALVEAATRCARALLRDVGRRASAPELLALERRLKALQGTVLGPLDVEPGAPWRVTRTLPGLAYALRDDDGRTLSFGRRSRAGLPALLVDGQLSSPAGAPVDGLPFLTLMGLARAATEGQARLGDHPLTPRAVFSAGIDLCLTLRARNPALAANPWLEALQVRCTDGLKALREPVPDLTAASAAPPRSEPAEPLTRAGTVRRLSLKARWSRPVALGEEGGQLALAQGHVVVSSAHVVQVVTRRGQTLFRRMSSRGVATLGLSSLCATSDRLLYFDGGRESASWLRDHDGATVGPALLLVDGVLVAPLARRGVVGLEPATGRERWRFDPPRTQRSWLSTAGSRVLMTTDGGTLHGLDASSGQVRFSIRSSMPCAAPAVRSGRQAVTLVRRSEQAAVFVCDALASGRSAPAGTLTWTRELNLAGAGTPVVSRGQVYVLGHREGRGVVVALSRRGQVLWERPTPLEPNTQAAVPFEHGLLVTDARGGALRLLPDGQAAWVLGGSADQLSVAVAPVLRRGVLVVPGPVVRLVDPTGGRLLAQVETGPHITGLAVDAQFTLYALHEPGVLEAFEPGAVLSLVT